MIERKEKYFTVMERCYPQPDRDMFEDDDWLVDKAIAEKYCREITEAYQDPEWEGHPRYKSSFYVKGYTEEEVMQIQSRYAAQRAAAEMDGFRAEVWS